LGFTTGNEVHKYYFGVWILSGLRMWFVARNKRGGWLSLRWFRTTTRAHEQRDGWATYLS
jgi:hypothetical protein